LPVEADDRSLPDPAAENPSDVPAAPIGEAATRNGHHASTAHRNPASGRLPLLAPIGNAAAVDDEPRAGREPPEPDAFEEPRLAKGSFAAVGIERDDDLASIFGKIDSADSPRVALVARRGNRALATQLGMRRLQRHLDLSGRDLMLVTRARVLRVRAREEGVPTTTSLRRVDFDRRHGGLHLGWMTLRLPTIGALLALALFVVMAAAGTAVLFWYVPKATVTVYVPTETIGDTMDLVLDTRATDVDLAKHVLPARRREITVTRTLPGPATGVAKTPMDHAAIGITFTNKRGQPVTVSKGTVVTAANGMPFTTASDVILAPRIGATGEAIALANRPGTEGNIPANTARGLDPALADLVTATNPNPGEKGVDRQYTVVSQNDVDFLKNTFALSYLIDAGKKELLQRFADTETIFADGAKGELTDCTPVPPVGQEAHYVDLTCTATVSVLSVPDSAMNQVAVDFLRPKLGADKQILDNSIKVTPERPGTLDEAFDRLSISPRVSALAIPYVDQHELRAVIAGKSRTDAERAIRNHVATSQPPAIDLAGWAPWLPRKTHRITLDLKPAQ
jgi:hypothetical protein